MMAYPSLNDWQAGSTKIGITIGNSGAEAWLKGWAPNHWHRCLLDQAIPALVGNASGGKKHTFITT